MTPRRRRTRTPVAIWSRGICRAAALAAVIALAASGCSAAPPANPDSNAYHGLTLAAAESAYQAYVTVSQTAAAQGNKAQGLAMVGDAQWSIVNEQFTALASASTPVPTYRYGQPVFYVPALTTWSEWFMVAVPRTTETGAQAGTTADTVLLFEKRGPGQPWTVDGSVVLEGSDFALFSLQTADGGALVMYGMYLNTTTSHPGLAAGAPIPVPAGFTPLTGPAEVGLHAVDANWTYEFAAVDPPSAERSAKLQVIASGGGPTYGRAY